MFRNFLAQAGRKKAADGNRGGFRAPSKKVQFWAVAGAGLALGLLNGLLGTGGGIVAVPALSWLGCKGKESHATSLAVMLPLTVLSAGLYLFSGRATLSQAAAYLPGGLVGAAIGGLVLRRTPATWLRKMFALLLIYAGIRFLL